MSIQMRTACRCLQIIGINSVLIVGLASIVLLTTNVKKNHKSANYVDESGLPVVQTTAGKVQGIRVTSNGRYVHAFYGISYAEPPTRHRRFLYPLPKAAYQGVFKADTLRAECPQFPYTFNTEHVNVSSFDEDCLHLNLWTPSLDLEEPPRAVVVFFYGGSFQNGGNNLPIYDGRHFSSMGDVVVVVPNYRLNIFGFLYTGTKDAPGNQGIWDQRLALLWVHDNIRQFGGDPERVVLMGQSAGAISVGYHIISPLTRHLFKRAIMQSGTPFYKADENKITGPDKVIKIASRLCGSSALGMSSAVACLRKQPAKALLREASSILGLKSSSFVPISGDDLLPEDPLVVMHNGSMEPIDLLIGTTDQEGTYFLQKLYQAIGVRDPFEMSNAQHAVIIQFLMNYTLWETPGDLLTQFLRSTKDGSQPRDVVDTLAEAVGDVAMRCPTLYFSDFVSQHNSSVYCYSYGYKPEKGTFWPSWMGTTHFDDFPFVWGYVFDKPELTSVNDKDYSSRLIRMWSSFIKNGTIGDIDGVSWPPRTKTSKNCIHLSNQIQPVRPPKRNTCSLLRKYIVPYHVRLATAVPQVPLMT
ncbi:cholinesterase 1-like [Ornithodoros turicata]|uniref:cholinesterase 1-like n=1 Tax=Ornithodoros turicata TaxID=34597 RepID=UPI003138DD94